jgi:hypothetical protein
MLAFKRPRPRVRPHRPCVHLPPCTDVAAGLGEDEGAGVEARLYKLLLYEPGGHFVTHRDTEKEAGMFATLLICLPVGGGHQVRQGRGMRRGRTNTGRAGML